MNPYKLIITIALSAFFTIATAEWTHAQTAGSYYKIVNNVSKMALVTNGQTEKGSTVYKKDWSTSGDGSRWTFIPQGAYFTIKNKHSGMFLAAMGAKNRGDVLKITNTPGQGALWKLVQDDKKRYTIINKANGLAIANMKDAAKNTPAKFNTGSGPGTKWLLLAK